VVELAMPDSAPCWGSTNKPSRRFTSGIFDRLLVIGAAALADLSWLGDAPRFPGVVFAGADFGSATLAAAAIAPAGFFCTAAGAGIPESNSANCAALKTPFSRAFRILPASAPGATGADPCCAM